MSPIAACFRSAGSQRSIEAGIRTQNPDLADPKLPGRRALPGDRRRATRAELHLPGDAGRDAPGRRRRPDRQRRWRALHSFANVTRLCRKSSTSSRRCCCWSSSRRSTSARSSSPGASMAKRWHPDIAPPGKQFEHERHLKAINEAADQLESLAEGSRGGRVSRNAVRASARRGRASARAEEGARAYEAEQRAARRGQGSRRARPVRQRACPTTRSCTATRAASPTRSGASASVTGIYFTGEGDDDACSGRA